MDELGDRLEDLGIEVGVEFLYYAELCETFWRIKKLGSRKSYSSLLQAVAIAHLGLTGDKITLCLQNSIAFIIKLNTPTQHYCKIFYIGS